MLIIFMRSLILYLAILIALRAMGKGEVAEMNCFDLVIIILIADVASIPMGDNSIPIIYGIASITGLTLMQTFISYISLKNRKISLFISGSPTILINKGKIDYKQLKKERISIDELLEQLRISGYFNITDVQYAILEADGDLSVLPSPSYNSPPSKTFKHLPTSVILDGVLIEDSLSALNKNMHWLLGVLNAHHIKNIEDVLLCIIDENDKVFVQKKEI